jgi:hypothetical protein
MEDFPKIWACTAIWPEAYFPLMGRVLPPTTACSKCPLKSQCTTGPERRIARWEHDHLLDAVQQRLDANPQAMRQRRETVEHPFGTMKARMGATHFLMKTLPKVAAEMALSVLAYNGHEHRRHHAADRGDPGEKHARDCRSGRPPAGTRQRVITRPRPISDLVDSSQPLALCHS